MAERNSTTEPQARQSSPTRTRERRYQWSDAITTRDARTDGRMDGRTDGRWGSLRSPRTDGRTDGGARFARLGRTGRWGSLRSPRADGRTDGRTDGRWGSLRSPRTGYEDKCFTTNIARCWPFVCPRTSLPHLRLSSYFFFEIVAPIYHRQFRFVFTVVDGKWKRLWPGSWLVRFGVLWRVRGGPATPIYQPQSIPRRSAARSRYECGARNRQVGRFGARGRANNTRIEPLDFDRRGRHLDPGR